VAATADISMRSGQASLGVERVFDESTVTSALATSPMKLLTPRSRGPSVWAYTSSFGGGLVAGDQTFLDLQLGSDTRCFLSTQASTKVYRNPDLRPCTHETHAVVGRGSLLVFAPEPVQPFAQSRYAQQQRFSLAADASLVLVDWFSSGRSARGERWAFSHFASRNAVWRSTPGAGVVARTSKSVSRVSKSPNAANLQPRSNRQHRAELEVGDAVPLKSGETCPTNDELLFLDSLRLDPGDGDLASPHRCGRFNCIALLLLLGPLVRGISAALLQRAGVQPVTRRETIVCSASPVREGAIFRIAGEQTEPVGRELRHYLNALCVHLGDDPWSRKW